MGFKPYTCIHKRCLPLPRPMEVISTCGVSILMWGWEDKYMRDASKCFGETGVVVWTREIRVGRDVRE